MHGRPNVSSAVPGWGIVGHARVVTHLDTVLRRGSVHHAYAFLGPEAIGKFHCATLFAEQLLCTRQDAGASCETCQSCLALRQSHHPDYLVVSAAEGAISVEHVRGLIGFLRLRPLLGGYRVAIIRDAELLSVEAANALLKQLEEPGAQTVIVLTATHPDHLPATILSRCQRLQFTPVATSEIVRWLRSCDVPVGLAQRAVAASNGRPGLARSLATAEADARMQLELKMVLQACGSTIEERLRAAQDWAGLEPTELDERLWVTELLLRDGLLVGLKAQSALQLPGERGELVRWSARLRPAVIGEAIEAVWTARKLLAANVSPKFAVEYLMLSFHS